MFGSHFAIRLVDDSAAKGQSAHDLVRMFEPGKGKEGKLWLKREGAIEGNVVSDAVAGFDPDGEPGVLVRLTPAARDQLAVLTRANVGHRIAILVNGRILVAPIVLEPMMSDEFDISGGFTEREARALAAEIRNSATSR